ncbi:MAG: Uma2 family endonuclease, partial [Cyanobacteriota bacterium]|nr:Uma2 family endonuclease [Cyanobacteriota bacterium]
MSATRTPIPQSDPPRSPKETLPTMYDLPSESPEEPGLPDEYHLWQAELCSITFCPPTHSLDQVLVASDLNLYYDPNHTG